MSIMANKLHLIIGIAAVLSACQSAKITNTEITIPELQHHIQFLASDSLKGRLPGTVEGRIAASTLKMHLMRMV